MNCVVSGMEKTMLSGGVSCSNLEIDQNFEEPNQVLALLLLRTKPVVTSAEPLPMCKAEVMLPKAPNQVKQGHLQRQSSFWKTSW